MSRKMKEILGYSLIFGMPILCLVGMLSTSEGRMILTVFAAVILGIALEFFAIFKGFALLGESAKR